VIDYTLQNATNARWFGVSVFPPRPCGHWLGFCLEEPEQTLPPAEEALAFKDRGNIAYKAKEYQSAIDWHSQAIGLLTTLTIQNGICTRNLAQNQKYK